MTTPPWPRQQSGAFFGSPRVGDRADSNRFEWQPVMARRTLLVLVPSTRTPPVHAAPAGVFFFGLHTPGNLPAEKKTPANLGPGFPPGRNPWCGTRGG